MLKLSMLLLAIFAISACSTNTPKPVVPVTPINGGTPPPETTPTTSQPSNSTIPPLSQRILAGEADNPSCGDPRGPSSAPRKQASEWTAAEEGIDLIKQYESFQPRVHRPGNIDLIGYGHAILPGETFSTLTEAEAEELLRKDIAERQLLLGQMIEVPVTQNEFTAILSLAYSMGMRRLAGDSTMAALNSNDLRRAADEITTIRRGANRQILPGLVKRRQEECSLFLSP